MGSLVESIVKITKRLISGFLKNNVVNLRDFEYLIAEVVSLGNKRPLAFLESLRDDDLHLPEVITPELLLRGYNLLHVNLVPHLENIPDDPDWDFSARDKANSSSVKDIYSRLRRVRSNLKKVYHEEYITRLIDQATDRKGRYIPIKHKGLQKGDKVLL